MEAVITRFDELTWPEVAVLPRELPILLPLGPMPDDLPLQRWPEGYAKLPALPYGWEGSLLPTDPAFFQPLLENLFGGLREDGYTDLNIGLPAHLQLEVPEVAQLKYDNLPDAAFAVESQKVILIPLGHTEQHGFHLPLNTDTVIIDAIAQGIRRIVPDSAAALPVFPYGVSTHRGSFAGTFNLGGRAYEDFLLEVIRILCSHGGDRFYLLNGHGGNHSFLVNVVKYAGERYPQTFTATAWLHTSGALGSSALARHRRSERGGMGHAGELETALMLHLKPALVHMDRVVDEVDFIANDHYYMDWVEGGDLIANPPWSDDTRTGSYGAGSLATAQNGKHWLQMAITEKVAHVHSIHDQQNRRLRRRREQGT